MVGQAAIDGALILKIGSRSSRRGDGLASRQVELSRFRVSE